MRCMVSLSLTSSCHEIRPYPGNAATPLIRPNCFDPMVTAYKLYKLWDLSQLETKGNISPFLILSNPQTDLYNQLALTKFKR